MLTQEHLLRLEVPEERGEAQLVYQEKLARGAAPQQQGGSPGAREETERAQQQQPDNQEAPERAVGSGNMELVGMGSAAWTEEEVVEEAAEEAVPCWSEPPAGDEGSSSSATNRESKLGVGDTIRRIEQLRRDAEAKVPPIPLRSPDKMSPAVFPQKAWAWGQLGPTYAAPWQSVKSGNLVTEVPGGYAAGPPTDESPPRG